MIVWLAVRDKLSTGERMLKWNPQGDAICVLCQGQVETRNHLFFECVYSETVWKGLMRKFIGSRYTSNWNQLLEILINTNQDNTTLFLIRYTFQAVLYSIWRERKCRRHGAAKPCMRVWFVSRCRQRMIFFSSKIAQKISIISGTSIVQKCFFLSWINLTFIKKKWKCSKDIWCRQ